MSRVLEHVGSKLMKIWLQILGGAYIVVGGLHIFLFLFILGVFGGKWGIEAISVEEYFPVIGHLGGWVLYVLLGFSGASILAGVGLLKLSAWSGRLATLLSVGNLFILPFWDDHRIVDDFQSAFQARPMVSSSCSRETAELKPEHKRRFVILLPVFETRSKSREWG